MKRSYTVYGVLFFVWAAIMVWQGLEHYRFRESERLALLTRARDISNTLGIVIRSQRGPGGVVDESRLQKALEELVGMDELQYVALLNAADEIVTSASDGVAIDTSYSDTTQSGERWVDESVSFINLVDLGEDQDREDGQEQTAIVMRFPRFDERRPPPPPDEFRREFESENRLRIDNTAPDIDEVTQGFSEENFRRDRRGGGGGGIGGRGRARFFRPFWMSENEYQALLQKQGLHKFVMMLSTDAYQAACMRDIWIRSAVIIFASIATLGMALAWRSLTRSAELQVSLVRASEMNAHLREMNLAAAGLAHETKNPLNIVRGLAQLIAKQNDVPPVIQNRTQQIMEEVDRVTVQLNEFIEYSKPRAPVPAPVDLQRVIRDVERTLDTDLDDKRIQFRIQGPQVTIKADEPLLRQVIFNLLLNSIHSVQPKGSIDVLIGKSGTDTVYLDIVDDGPGVPAPIVEQIFQPYFTTTEQGTGLGLAVVHQIVRAHGWDIQYITNEKGAHFRISNLKLTSKGTQS